MPPSTIEPHLRKIYARDDISAEEEQVVRDLVSEVVTYEAHRVIARPWQDLNHSTLLLEGWMGRVRDMESGARQFTELTIAGDFVDLHSFTLKQLDHEIVTLTRSTVAIVPHERLKQLTIDHPHLTRIYWFMTNLDAVIHREWMVSLGRRSAVASMAHLFCEMLARLGVVGRADERGFEFPLNQSQLADCLGLTTVHVNRTLQDLRARKLVELRSQWLKIIDLPQLRQVAEFDPSYLYIHKRRR